MERQSCMIMKNGQNGKINNLQLDVCNCYSECISTPGKLEKYAWPRWDSNLITQ